MSKRKMPCQIGSPGPDDLAASRAAWRNRGQQRPPFADTPGPGQESVWDYPRPPVLQADTRSIIVKLGGVTLAHSRRGQRLLETAGAPCFYLPPDDVDTRWLRRADRRSLCEWKGQAHYWHVEADGLRAEQAVWCYPDAWGDFSTIAGWFAFYPDRLECYVDGERARPQPGGYYGGWMTDELVGPFKGEPGTGSW